MPATFHVLKGPTSLRERVANEVRTLILGGDLRPGDRLIETEIAEQMGVSRGPVREALRELEQEGLVVTEPYRQTVVANVSEEEITEVLVPARRLLEKFVLTRVPDKLTAEDYQRLNAIIDEMRLAAEKGDWLAVVESDMEFHHYLLAASGYKSLVRFWQGMVARIRIHFLRETIHNPDLKAVPGEHVELLQALRDKDLARINALVTEHVR